MKHKEFEKPEFKDMKSRKDLMHDIRKKKGIVSKVLDKFSSKTNKMYKGAQGLARYITQTSAKKSIASENRSERKRIGKIDAEHDKYFKKAQEAESRRTIKFK